MVVDDDPDIRTALRSCLVSEGYDVAACTDGRDALDQMEFGLRPEAIVLDLMMPRMNGFEFLDVVKADARWSGIPVVMVSANRGYSPEDLGVYRVLRKPFDLRDLLEALRSVSNPAGGSA